MAKLSDIIKSVMDTRPILVVEDNPDDELLMLRALKKNNIANPIVIAHDGVEALDYLFARGKFEGRNPADIPALILLDLKLPKVDGFEVLKAIRADARLKYIPVVILTSSDQDRDVIDGYDLGANSYVRKPVDFEEFVDATGKLGLYWLLVNKQPPIAD
jgi:two-component system response regulator